MGPMSTPGTTLERPIECPAQRVETGWIDYNGHLNMAYYAVVFDRAVDYVYDRLGIGADYTASGAGSCFTLEIHVTYLRELLLDDPLRVTFQLIDRDAKRLHFFQHLYQAELGYLAATSEQMAMHVDLHSRRSAPFPAAAMARIDDLLAAHRALPRPDQVGHVITVPARR
jgi:acyl-CoA thioester hydrolase